MPFLHVMLGRVLYRDRMLELHKKILQTCCLSPSDGEIFPFWFSSPRLPVSANDLHVFEKISDAPR